MSEQEEKPTPTPNITSDVKEKDPKRVAAGKRLGAKSKQYKEAKKQRQLQQEETETSRTSYNLGPVLCVIGGLAIGGTIAYHVLFKKKDEKLENEEISETKPKSKRYLEDD